MNEMNEEKDVSIVKDKLYEYRDLFNNMDDFYEFGYLVKTRSNNIREAMQLVENNKLSFNHPSFSEVRKKMENIKTYLDKPFDTSEGSEKCNYCGSNNTLAHAVQMRSGDEGATVIIFCITCKKRYTMNS